MNIHVMSQDSHSLGSPSKAVDGAEQPASGSAAAFALDRRDMLRGALGLVICFTAGLTAREARASGNPMVGAYVQIAPDNTVTVFVGAAEMGQGIMTGLAQLVAEELSLDWSKVRAVHAPAAAAYANPMFHLQLTGGSTSMRGWYTPLRQAAAVAREMLITAGAAALKQPRTSCTVNHGAVWCGAASVTYGTIAAAAANVTPPNPATVTLVSNLKVIGQRLPRTDIPSKVDGSAVYGIDVRLPGMLYAAVVHCPQYGGTVGSMPGKPGNAIALVNLGNAVGVVAGDTWSAFGIARGLRVNWSVPASASAIDSAKILSQAQSYMANGTPQVEDLAGAPDAALAASVKQIDATYQLPYLAHACMEVLACTASVTSTSCEIWAPTQAQALCVLTAQSITGLSPSQITVHTTMLGGGLGRKFEQDFVSQAIQIAKAVGKPVKLTWSREQDFQHDKYRPCALIRVRAGVDAAGRMSLIYRNVSPSIALQNNPKTTAEDPGAVAGALALPYTVNNRRIEYVPLPGGAPIGYWRSVGESYNTFAVESAIDELAHAAGADPLAFRQGLLAANPRALAVLNAVASLSGWSSPPPSGRARGLAFLSGFGSLVAMVAEVTSANGNLRPTRMFCAVDCGTAVNPDSIEAQIQGGIVHGLSATLWGQATFAAGASKLSNFNSYRMVRGGEMPQVAVTIVNSAGPIGGIGEVGVPCVAPALANAWARLTGARQRTLPFYPGATMGDS